MEASKQASPTQEDNPFLALFESSAPTSQSIDHKPPASPPRDLSNEHSNRVLQKLNKYIEDIFAFTTNAFGFLGRKHDDPIKKSGLVMMESIAMEIQHQQGGRLWMDLDILGRALFERVLLSKEDLKNALLTENVEKIGDEGHAVQTKVMHYLADCYIRCFNYQKKLEQKAESLKETEDDEIITALSQMKSLIVQNSSTALREPEIFMGQSTPDQIDEILTKYPDAPYGLIKWLEDTSKDVIDEGGQNIIKSIIEKIVFQIKKDVVAVPFIVISDSHVIKIQYFIRTPILAKMFILANYPKVTLGPAFMDTLIGSILAKSCLPTTEMGSYDFFEEPSKQPPSVHNSTEGRIWTATEIVHELCHEIFNALFRVDAEVKHLTLMWIGDCFKANIGRGKMWTNEMGPLLSNTLASDGFMLNLGAVLLMFCKPFSQGVGNAKMLKIDPTYTSIDCNVSEDARLKNVHFRDAGSETFLIPSEPEEKENEDVPETFNFITDIFFLTHKSLDLGFRVCHEKFVKMNQELGRHQQMYRELVSTGQTSSPTAEVIQKKMDSLMTRYLSLKAALLIPSTLENSFLFGALTGSWMIQLAFHTDSPRLTKFREVLFPLKECIPPSLKYIPEFVVENICELLLLMRRFCPQQFEHNGEYLSSMLDFILTFMGSPKWVKNPHLRARLAEGLENILPMHRLEGGASGNLGSFHREHLFMSHPNRLEIVPTLLHVFVDIEATGQAVQFEMKFSYRRPMYDIMKYVWEMDEYKDKFLLLAKYAEAHIEDEDAPIFLRFVNLLINDAIFLLDEALSYMKQIQEQQHAREHEWQNLPANERGQNEAQLNQIGRMARYHNIMGTETIQILDKLTGAINVVFTHPTMVDRIAAMLNYFLQNLVGPTRKQLKVKNVEDYAFNPGEIVTNICKIYVNFKNCDNFLASVSRDGRSYSPELFEQASNVLLKIGQGELETYLQNVAAKVNKSAENQRVDEELFADAPDEYLDSIMSHLMTDPVRLPNSLQIVDRSTIARHLLSDQNDPFTRAPLTMEQIEPLDDLKYEIQKWMEDKRKNQSI